MLGVIGCLASHKSPGHNSLRCHRSLRCRQSWCVALVIEVNYFIGFIREAEKIRKSGKDMMLLPLQLTAAIVNLLLVLMFDATLQSWVFETKG
ncbi:hypothetical protein Tco_1149587 [Tanacetum coccineum]